MGRKQIYYVESTIEPPRMTNGGEFLVEETLLPYTGVYHIANETYLTGPRPTDASKILIPSTGKEGLLIQLNILN